MLKKDKESKGWAQSLKDLLLISGFISFLNGDLGAVNHPEPWFSYLESGHTFGGTQRQLYREN